MSDSSAYSHEATVAAITSYYEFVKRVHSSENTATLRYPPPTGWPQITKESFASLGKTDAVIELLRHIPYFSDNIEILDKTHPFNFIDDRYVEIISEDSRKQLAKTSDDQQSDGGQDSDDEDGSDEEPEDDDDDEVDLHPASMIFLTSHDLDSNEYGYTIYIDTDRGVIILEKNDSEFPKKFPNADADSFDTDVDQYGPNKWKMMPTFRIQTFFDMCKEQWTNLNFMPRLDSPGRIYQLYHFGHPSGTPTYGEKFRQRIMKEAGWPGDGNAEGWDKAKAEREMLEHENDLGA